jgi:iron complex outermembrane receptor protein
MLSGGFRADWRSALQEVTLQGDAYRGEVDGGPMREFSGASLRGRVSRDLGAGSRFTIQSYYDRTYRKHEASFEETLQTFDLEMQHATRPRAGHMLVLGGGYRASRDDVTNSAAQAFIPEDRRLHWANGFVQDEIEISRACRQPWA